MTLGTADSTAAAGPRPRDGDAAPRYQDGVFRLPHPRRRRSGGTAAVRAGAGLLVVKPPAIAIGLALAIVVGALIGWFDLAAPIERPLVDAGFVTLRGEPVPATVPEIVVLGVDERTVAAIPEPVALWHRELGALLRAAAGAGARAVGIDLVLPERSYAAIAPDLDRALVDGILAMRQAGAVVLAVTADEGGRPRALHAPFRAAAGSGGIGYALWHLDPDRVVRRFDEALGANGEIVPTFTGQLARVLGVEPKAGFINYALGDGFDVLPLITVLEWARAGDSAKLAQALAGRVVLVGTTLPFFDRIDAPVTLGRHPREEGNEPGVFVHAQTLRSLLAQRMVQPLPAWLAALLAGLAGLAWLAGRRPATAAAVVAAVIVAALVGGQRALGHDVIIPAAAIIVTAALAAGMRLLLEAGYAWRERLRLRSAFAGYVSPQVMGEIEDGRLAGLAVARRFICVLVLDVRNFTTRSEKESPERIVTMLNALCEEATAAIHAQGGTVDKFMGDGILAFFGAPAPHDDPCAAGFAAARSILERVRQMGQNLAAAGETPIEIGIGLSCGEAIVGHIGAATRHAYTAIGDCVNVAARLESLTKELGHPMVLSHAVVERLAERDRLVALGVQPLKGHTPHEVYGWR